MRCKVLPLPAKDQRAGRQKHHADDDRGNRYSVAMRDHALAGGGCTGTSTGLPAAADAEAEAAAEASAI